MSLLSRLTLGIGLCLFAYGYISRTFHIYFFWESTFVGWLLLLLGSILWLAQRIKTQPKQSQQRLLSKVSIGCICFLLFVQVLTWVLLGNTNAYTASVAALQHHSKLQQEIGPLQRVSIKPMGHIAVQTSEAGEVGDAELHLIAKGSRKFKDIRLLVSKELDDSVWKVRVLEVQ